MWLYVPSISSPSAPASVASTSDLESLSQTLEQSVSWRGKRSRAPIWLRRWKAGLWITRLSGLTCSPSTADRGVESWIASLRASLASPTASPESGSDMTTSERSGPSSSESSKSVSPPWSSSKTSLLLFNTSSQSEIDYQHWATGLRRAYSARVKSARRIDASDSLLWPTAQTHDVGTRGNTSADHHYRAHDLSNAAEDWPTPCANDDNKSPEAHLAMKARMRGGPRNTITSLQVKVQEWPTPKTPTGGPESRGSRGSRGSGGEDLEATAQNWKTPQAFSFDKSHLPGQNAVSIQVKDWATPTSRDWKDGACQNANVPENSLLGRQVLKGTGAQSRLTSHRHWTSPRAGGNRTSPRAMTERTDGKGGLAKPSLEQQATGEILITNSKKSLNPLFVEWLMGWPIGHTMI